MSLKVIVNLFLAERAEALNFLYLSYFTMVKDYGMLICNIFLIIMELNNIKLLQREMLTQQKQINELYVVIDTLQTNLRSAVTHMPEAERSKVVGVRSYKWCTNWKPGDEKI